MPWMMCPANGITRVLHPSQTAPTEWPPTGPPGNRSRFSGHRLRWRPPGRALSRLAFSPNRCISMTSHLLSVSTVAVIDSSPLAFIPALLLPQWLTGPEMQKDPIHRPAIGLKRKKGAYIAVQGRPPPHRRRPPPVCCSQAPGSGTAGSGLEQPQRLLLCLRLLRRFG